MPRRYRHKLPPGYQLQTAGKDLWRYLYPGGTPSVVFSSRAEAIRIAKKLYREDGGPPLFARWARTWEDAQ